jgi:hypothetical protein
MVVGDLPFGSYEASAAYFETRSAFAARSPTVGLICASAIRICPVFTFQEYLESVL